MVLTSNISDSEVKWEKTNRQFVLHRLPVIKSPSQSFHHNFIDFHCWVSKKKNCTNALQKFPPYLECVTIPCGIWMLKTVIELVLIIKSEVD